MSASEKERREARAKWTTTVSRDAESADKEDVAFWLSLTAEQRIDLVARLSLEAYRRMVGDPDARPQLDRSVLTVSRP